MPGVDPLFYLPFLSYGGHTQMLYYKGRLQERTFFALEGLRKFFALEGVCAACLLYDTLLYKKLTAW